METYRGWEIKPYEGVQLGYHTGEGAKSRPGKGRKVRGYVCAYAPDACEKIVDTLKQAREYIDQYMGPLDEGIQKNPSEVVHEKGPYWVRRTSEGFHAMVSGVTHSVSDSTYADSSLAIARVDYLMKTHTPGKELTRHARLSRAR